MSYDSLAHPSMSTPTDTESAPSYTSKPQLDEVTLDGSFVGGLPTGEFEATRGPLTLRLRGQIEGISRPTIYHKGRVSGTIMIRSEECAGATQFEGILSLDIDSGITQTINTLNETHVVWQSADGSGSPPSVVPFAVELAPEFLGRDGQGRPLPPSCDFSFPAPMALRARVKYNMTVVVDRRKKHGVLSRNKSLTLPFDYMRRTKPHLPMTASPSANWYHYTCPIHFKSQSSEPLQARLSIPAAKVYWIGHNIPFQLGISGPAAALGTLFPAEGGAAVSVSLVRQIVATVRKMPARREMVLGVGEMRGPYTSGGAASVRWEGHVRVKQPGTMPGFDAGALLVKDFIVAEITPPLINPAPFNFPSQKIPVFIRFTTERHEEDSAYQ
ncbi:hypothetical protein HDZ31DRAFT_36446 [Schizophyllum fasciatum]